MLGLSGLGCTLTVVPPGKRAYPFHRHHVFSELFYILAGSGEVRLDDRTLPVRAGDLIASPAGAEAHQIINTGQDELRYLAISDMDQVDVIDYPDSKKMGCRRGRQGRRPLDRDLQGVRSRDAGRLFRWRGASPAAHREARNPALGNRFALCGQRPGARVHGDFNPCNRLAWLRRQIAC